MVKKKIRRGIRLSKYIIYKETLIDYKENFWSFAGAFIGIGLISYAQSFQLAQHENLFLIGSFGASSVLIFGAIQSPLAQPRNLIGGPFISAIRYHYSTSFLISRIKVVVEVQPDNFTFANI
jgi:CBS-domain-containing membrane protein